MTTNSEPPVSTATEVPAKPHRIIRSNGRTAFYKTAAQRDQGAQRWADTDQAPVATADITDPDTGWVTARTFVPVCQSVGGRFSGRRYRCHDIELVGDTGYCLTHQHVYRSVNGIPDPEPAPSPARHIEVEDHLIEDHLVEGLTESDYITISLEIENSYDDGTEITTVVTDVKIPAPPNPDDTDAWESWEYDHIFQFTGTGRTDGDSWYVVTVTACSDPTLVDREFTFGY